MDTSVQILKIALKVLLVIPTCQPIHSSCGILLEFRECLCEVINTDVMEERGELLLLPLPCSLPYALQRLCHGSPVLCPARALLTRIPLGPRPWLHQLRSRLPGFVRWLHSYYGEVRPLTIVHHRLRLLAFPTRASAASMLALADHETSRFPSKERAHLPVSKTTPGRLGARVIAPFRVAFRHRNDVGTQDEGTFAAQWLAYALLCQRFANTRGYLRMTRGRCGSLLLHRDGLAPSTPCRSPGALRSTLINGDSQSPPACLKGANNRP